MRGSYLGPEFRRRDRAPARRRRRRLRALRRRALLDRTAALLADEKVVGWLQGRMEFGPRALGDRSILGDPRSTKMQSVMNLKIKYRESFRPFAPSVLRERVADYFELDTDSPYMLLVAPVQRAVAHRDDARAAALFGIEKLNVPRSTLPAVTHVDYSARIQTVHARRTRATTRCSALRGAHRLPVAREHELQRPRRADRLHPADAYRCFMRTEMDVLVVGSFLMLKERQPKLERDSDWRREFELD
jgi:carbamoyltransferase